MINYSVSLRQNPTDPEEAKKAYANAQVNEVLDINEFAEHITSHGCVYSKGDIVGILTIAVACIKEQLLAGNSVQLGDLGKFYISLKSKGATSIADFTSQNIKKVNCKWAPGDDFKSLINSAEFSEVTSRKLQKKSLADSKK